MTEDATADQFLVREDATDRPTETSIVELGGNEIELEAELASEAFMQKLQQLNDGEGDEDFLVRRLLAKYEKPAFETIQEDGYTVIPEKTAEQLASRRGELLIKEYFIMNGFDRETMELAEEKRKELLLEENPNLTNGA